MKKRFLFICIFLCFLTVITKPCFAQYMHIYPWIEESDGSPTGVVSKFITPNGSTSLSSTTATISFDIAGGWTDGGTSVYLTTSTDNVGIGESAPESDIEITSTAPYITMHNSTDEKTDGGMESRIRFKGEDPNGVEWHLATIQASHDGTTADGKADIIFSTNDGNDADDTLQERMRIDSSGNVGIGTSAPQCALHVLDTGVAGTPAIDTQSIVFQRSGGASSNNSVSIVSGNTGSSILQFGDTDQIDRGHISYLHSSNSMSFRVNGGTKVTIDSSGNVGIGTASPDALLHAEKSTAGTNSLQEVARFSVTTTDTPAAGFGPEITFESETDPNSAGHMEVTASIGAPIEDGTTDSEDGGIAFRTMTNGATRTEKMRLHSTGDLVLSGSFNYGVDSQATDAYVVDLDPNLSAYRDGLIVYWDANNPNDGACTLRLTGGLTAKAIKTQGHDDPPANYIEANSRPGVMFNATADYWMLITPDANP